MRLAAALALLSLLVPPALAATPAPTWKVSELGPHTCVALGPDGSGGSISFGATGPILRLLISADSLPDAAAAYQAEVTIDKGAPAAFAADGSDGVIGIPVTPDFSAALAGAHRITVAVAGHTFVFDVKDIGEAMTSVDQCAGAVLADHAPPPATTIHGAGDWRLTDDAAANGCSARLAGDQVDTVLIINDKGKLILAAGRPDWDSPATHETVTLQVDDRQPRSLEADALQSLVLVLIDDSDLLQTLRDAHRLTWTLPSGKVSANVTGLGVALDAAAACMRAKPAPAPTT